MKDFFQWAVEEKKFDLSFLNDLVDAPEAKDADAAESTAAKRAGISANYPDAYVRAQYPHKYFNPIAADADFKLEAKPKKVPDNAVG